MRDNFNDLLWFLVVAEERSFTRTAAKIGITQSTLSHTIKRLETRMGFAPGSYDTKRLHDGGR